jgi:hypothetical protein
MGSIIENGVCLRYCNTSNHPSETSTPATNDNPAITNSLSLIYLFFASLNLVDNQRFNDANKNKNKAEAKNNLI